MGSWHDRQADGSYAERKADNKPCDIGLSSAARALVQAFNKPDYAYKAPEQIAESMLLTGAQRVDVDAAVRWLYGFALDALVSGNLPPAETIAMVDSDNWKPQFGYRRIEPEQPEQPDYRHVFAAPTNRCVYCGVLAAKLFAAHGECGLRKEFDLGRVRDQKIKEASTEGIQRPGAAYARLADRPEPAPPAAKPQLNDELLQPKPERAPEYRVAEQFLAARVQELETELAKFYGLAEEVTDTRAATRDLHAKLHTIAGIAQGWIDWRTVGNK